MRTRLTLLAAGVVAVALLVGGPLWVWGVQYRMLDDVRGRDRELAVMAALFRVRAEGQLSFSGSAGDLPPPRFAAPPGAHHGGVGAAEIEGGPSPRIDAIPEASLDSSGFVVGMDLPPGVGPPPGTDLGGGASLIIAMDHSPSFAPLSKADLLLLTPAGNVVHRDQEKPRTELVDWLGSVRDDPTLSVAANEMGELANGIARAMWDCLRVGVPSGNPGMRLPVRPPPECRDVVDRARGEATTRAARLGWPQRITSDENGERSLRTAVLIRFPEDERPYAVSIASPLASVDATVAALVRSLVLGGPLLLALVAGLAWYLVGRSLRVVGNIQREMEQIAFGTLDRRLEMPRTKDEVARLVVTLNRMLDRVADGARRQREFIGDASHELRSPIASIRTQLEVALSHPGATDWLRVAGGTNAEVIRMQKLVDDLLRIARLDDARDAPPDSREEVDLDDIVRSESAGLRAAKVGLSGVSPARMRGCEQDLRRIVRNLLENAERYGKGRVEVSLSRNGGVARLEIEDDGPGIPPDRRELVFERFTRLEESRSRASGGAGLGLSLARGLVEAHGGEIWIEEARLGGARLVVTLPLDASAAPAERRDGG